MWPRLLAVCAYLRDHPRPGRYLRELEIEGVDTKFVEAHQGLLWDLLGEALPPEAVDPAVVARAQRGFERRFGLRHEAPAIRLRVLDPRLAVGDFRDLAVPLSELAAWQAPVRRVYVTENKLNGLAFPDVPGAIVLFGLGYGVRALSGLPWLADAALAYWGDLDTHGFAMLAALRAAWPQTRSLLMDEATLQAHRAFWGEEPGQRWMQELAGLTAGEQAVFDGLRADRWGPRVRLEQERVPLSWLRGRLAETGEQAP